MNALSVSAARCSTPKRCCSSTTTMPRSAKETWSSSSAWVPITMPAWPEAMSSRAGVRWALVIDPVSRATVVPSSAPPSMPPAARSPSSAVIERWCCWASTSVGARSAAWPPESMTRSMARRATTVLPEPTSPWSSRFIGQDRASSPKIVSLISRCPSVRGHGRRCVERGEQAATVAEPRLPAEGADERPATGQHQLGHQRLLVAEVLAGRGDLRVVLRRVDPVERGPRVGKPVLAQQRGGHHVGHLVEHRPGEGDGALEVPRVDALGQRVDREQAVDALQQLLGLGVLLGVAAEDEHLGVGELPLVPEGAHLAGEHALVADREPARLPVGDVLLGREERHPQARPVGAQHHLLAVGHPTGAPVAVALLVAAADLPDHGQQLARVQLTDGGELAGAQVAAREVVEQVADGVQAEPVDHLGALGLLLGQQRRDGRVEVDHRRLPSGGLTRH